MHRMLSTAGFIDEIYHNFSSICVVDAVALDKKLSELLAFTQKIYF